MNTRVAYLPPLPPIVNGPALAAPALATPFPSERVSALTLAATVALTGITALAWAIRLDTTDNQTFVTAAATLALLATPAAYLLLRTGRRR